SSAFHTYDELYENIEKNSLIGNSTFIKVEYLSGHNSWYYNKPGSSGIAASKPAFISNGDLFEEISKLSKEIELSEKEENPTYNLKYLSNNIISICEREENNPFAKQPLIIIKENSKMDNLEKMEETLRVIKA